MKKRWGIVCGIVFTVLICLHSTVDSADNTKATVTSQIHVEQLELSDYVVSSSISGRKAPIPKEKAYKDWIFAGWYKTAECKQAIDTLKTSGSYYAKFVPQEILSVWCQTLKGTNENTASTQMRLISMVDSLNYDEVGFYITIGDETFRYSSQKVCSEITSGDVAVPFKPENFCELAKYFTTVTIVEYPNSKFSTGLQIAPYWRTEDGTVVRGVSRYARIEDSYKNIINVPIRMYSDAEIAAGDLEIAYNNRLYRYVPNENGISDTGFGLVKMQTMDTGNSVKCVGNVSDITTNVLANDLYVNLRFQMLDKENIPEEGSLFSVSNQNFYNKTEEKVAVEVLNGTYRTITTKEAANASQTLKEPLASRGMSKTVITRFNDLKNIGSCEKYSPSIVELSAEGIEKPNGAIWSGDKALKLNSYDWGVTVPLYVGDELKRVETLADEDYFLIWIYRNGGHWNGNYYALGNLDTDGIFNTNKAGQSISTTTAFNGGGNKEQWYALKFTAAELKAQMKKQGVSPAEWMNLHLNVGLVDDPTACQLYIYSIELFRETETVVARYDTMQDVTTSNWTDKTYQSAIINLDAVGIERPEGAVDVGDSVLQLRADDYYIRPVLYFGEKLNQLQSLNDNDYFLVWIYRDAYQWNENYYILGNVDGTGIFNTDTSGQNYDVRNSLETSGEQKKWYSMKFTVKELKEALQKQGISSAEWMFLQMNVSQDKAVYIYSVEYHQEEIKTESAGEYLGDVNQDGKLDSSDTVRYLKYLHNQTNQALSNADIDENSVVDGRDLEEMIAGILSGKKKQALKQRICLADFETYDDIYNIMNNYDTVSFTGYYTLSTLSSRQKKVQSLDGKSSLEVHIEGMLAESYYGYDKNAGSPARFSYNLFRNTKNNGTWGFDWKYVTGTSIEVYNDNDFDIQVSMLINMLLRMQMVLL